MLGRPNASPAQLDPGPARDELAWPVPPAEGRVVVEVLNATDRTGLARLAARLLRAQGLDVIAVGNADTTLATTQVVVRRGAGDGARDAVRALGAGRVSTAIDTLRRVDLTVLLGADFRPTPPLHP